MNLEFASSLMLWLALHASELRPKVCSLLEADNQVGCGLLRNNLTSSIDSADRIAPVLHVTGFGKCKFPWLLGHYQFCRIKFHPFVHFHSNHPCNGINLNGNSVDLKNRHRNGVGASFVYWRIFNPAFEVLQFFPNSPKRQSWSQYQKEGGLHVSAFSTPSQEVNT